MCRRLIPLGCVLLTGVAARAGIETGRLIDRSDQQEKAVTHIVVGRLRAFHELRGQARPGRPHPLARYVAGVGVEAVEKGSGIAPGSVIYPRFWSGRTREQLETVRIVPDCGDYKLDPLPGERRRLYLVLDEGYEYVADHPQGFFAIGEGGVDADASRGLAAAVPRRSVAWLGGGSLAGLVAGATILRSGRPKRRGRDAEVAG
jgi:hypothetical protein